MQLPIVYEESFLISDIMCYEGCGLTIENALNGYLQEHFPNAQIHISSEPMPYYNHKYKILIKSQAPIDRKYLTDNLKKTIDDVGFAIVNPDNHSLSSSINWLNIFINILTIAVIVILSLVFPPSLFLNIGLGIVCFSATLFTARDYIFNFFKSLTTKKFLSMPVTVSFGWLLALAHAIYHMQTMPLTANFAMTFMNFIMPVTLVTVVNIMDEIKRQIKKKTQIVYLNGIKSLFPQMQESYEAMLLTPEELSAYDELIFSNKYSPHARMTICENMLLKVKAGECFPVDGKIVYGSTVIDKSILNGEPPIFAAENTEVESGCLNIGQDVVVLTSKKEYASTANKILLQANAKPNTKNSKIEITPSNKFYYFYFSLFGLGLIISIVISVVFGTFSVGMMLQTMVGVLFAICPCTIGIAHILPGLLKTYQLSNDGIIVNSVNLKQNIVDCEVFVFDKTGTLTCNSKVTKSVDISENIWQKIYFIEKKFGRNHPIAKALQRYVETQKIPLDYHAETKDLNVAASGISVNLGGENFIIGSDSYLQNKNINIPRLDLDDATHVHVAIDGTYIGNITIRHELRPGMQAALQRLKPAPNSDEFTKQIKPKKLIMLTGDKYVTADSLNKQCLHIFDEIYAEHNPAQKSEKIAEIVKQYGAENVCYIGDGLNDALCSKKLRELGGTSIAISANDKAAFFTDMSLNGNLEFLFAQKKLNKQEKQIIQQNRWILALGSSTFFIFLIGFQISGLYLAPIIPMLVMFTTTLLVLLNSYRMQIAASNFINHKHNFFSKKSAQDDLSTRDFDLNVASIYNSVGFANSDV